VEKMAEHSKGGEGLKRAVVPQKKEEEEEGGEEEMPLTAVSFMKYTQNSKIFQIKVAPPNDIWYSFLQFS
jgi:hypothetical protein